MFASPTVSAALPQPQSSGDAVLADMLRALRLSGSVFLDAAFTTPFGVISPRRFDPGSPMAQLRHISVFHLITAGSCTLEIATGERREIRAGDVLLLPFADAHRFWNGDRVELVHADDVVRESRLPGMGRVRHGGGGAETRMVCGFLESSELLFQPLFRSLPPLIVDHAADDAVSAVIASTVTEIVGLADRALPGSELMLGRLMEALFVEVLRRYATGLPAGARGWFAALREPRLARALELIHAEPARRWTVEELARGAGASRTVLAERFAEMLGQTPMDYVAAWRMQLAAERLRRGTDSIAEIAAVVGYKFAASFNRAFKRVTGSTPGQWRDGMIGEAALAG